jgi:hypothetical protein
MKLTSEQENNLAINRANGAIAQIFEAITIIDRAISEELGKVAWLAIDEEGK